MYFYVQCVQLRYYAEVRLTISLALWFWGGDGRGGSSTQTGRQWSYLMGPEGRVWPHRCSTGMSKQSRLRYATPRVISPIKRPAKAHMDGGQQQPHG